MIRNQRAINICIWLWRIGFLFCVHCECVCVFFSSSLRFVIKTIILLMFLFLFPPCFVFKVAVFFSSKHFLNLKNQFDGADECGLKYEINYLCVRQKMSSMRISFSRSCPKWKQERIEIDSIFGAEGLTVNFTWLLFMNIITLDLRWDAFLYCHSNGICFYVFFFLNRCCCMWLFFYRCCVQLSTSEWCEAFLCTLCLCVQWKLDRMIHTLTFNLNSKEKTKEKENQSS